MKKAGLTGILCLYSIFTYTQWVWQNPLPQGNVLTSVFFVNENTGYAVGGVGTIVKTIDGGNTYTILSSPTKQTLHAVYFIDINTGYAIGDSGTIIKTTNGGGGMDRYIFGLSISIKVAVLYG